MKLVRSVVDRLDKFTIGDFNLAVNPRLNLSELRALLRDAGPDLGLSQLLKLFPKVDTV